MYSDLDVDDIINGLLDFVERRVMPSERSHEMVIHDPALKYDLRSGRLSETVRELLHEVRKESAAAGFYTLMAPTEAGGAELGALASLQVWEALHRRYGPAALLPYATVAHWNSGPSVLCGSFGPALRERYLDRIVSGELTGCFAMSESGAGSDAWSMSTTARRRGDRWVINGEKMWSTNGPLADYAYVFAVTNEAARREHIGGITCFLVPAESPGYQVDSVIRLFGSVGGNEAIISLSEVEVPDDHVVGEVGRGFDLALRGVRDGRIYNAGRSIGLAKWALAGGVDHARTRHAFGHPLSDYQGVSFQLADTAIELYAAETMARDCAARIDSGVNAAVHLDMTKAFTTEVAFRAYDRAMQVHGAMGLTNELGLHKGWHESRIVRIADGSAEVMRRNVARALVSGHYSVHEARPPTR